MKKSALDLLRDRTEWKEGIEVGSSVEENILPVAEKTIVPMILW